MLFIFSNILCRYTGGSKNQFSSQLAVEGHIPSNPVSQNSNSENVFLGTLCKFSLKVKDSVICFLFCDLLSCEFAVNQEDGEGKIQLFLNFKQTSFNSFQSAVFYHISPHGICHQQILKTKNQQSWAIKLPQPSPPFLLSFSYFHSSICHQQIPKPKSCEGQLTKSKLFVNYLKTEV